MAVNPGRFELLGILNGILNYGSKNASVLPEARACRDDNWSGRRPEQFVDSRRWWLYAYSGVDDPCLAARASITARKLCVNREVFPSLCQIETDDVPDRRAPGPKNSGRSISRSKALKRFGSLAWNSVRRWSLYSSVSGSSAMIGWKRHISCLFGYKGLALLLGNGPLPT